MRIVTVSLAVVFFLHASAHLLLANNTAVSGFRLLILGDSLSAGYGLQANESFPVQLETALRQAGHDVRVINAGVSGDTTAGGLARLGWAMENEPHIVMVELGGNDALRGLPPATTRNNLDSILEMVRQGGARVILAGMKAPRNLGDEYVTSFDRIYPELAEKHKVGFYPFFLKGVALNPELNLPDGIHPNAAGVKVIVNNVLPLVLGELLSLD